MDAFDHRDRLGADQGDAAMYVSGTLSALQK